MGRRGQTPLSPSRCRVLCLLSLLAVTLAVRPAASAQGCLDQLRQVAQHQSKSVISVAALQIPSKAWTHFAKARQASETGNADLFDRETELALKAAPNFADVYILRAANQVVNRQYNAAIASIAQARLIDPDIPWSGIILTSALTGLHRYTDAVAESERIHGLDAARWQWAFERTRAEVGLGNAAAALRYSELALAAAPAACADTHLLRANAFQLANRKAEAVVELQTYLDTPGTTEPARAQVQHVLESTRKKLQSEAGELLAAN